MCPIGSYTDPEYASVGLSEENARQRHDVVVGIERLDSLPRAIIDDRTTGFCKLVADADTHAILGATWSASEPSSSRSWPRWRSPPG